MDKIDISIVQKPNVDPIRFIATSTRLNFNEHDTFKQQLDLTIHDEKDENITTNLVKVMHSPLEHCSYSIIIRNASRAFLAQVTRSRVGYSYSSQSQAYTRFNNADFVVPIEIFEKCEELNSVNPLIDFFDSCNQSYKMYLDMQDKYGLKHDCTRAVTPQAMRNHLLITANIRAWLNLINLRAACNNTLEIRYIIAKIRELLIYECPEIFKLSGPNCWSKGKCFEGNRTCGQPWYNGIDPEQNRWHNLPALANKWRSRL